MKIKSLAELKRKMVKGCHFIITEHYYHPEFSGNLREVNVVQTNGVYSINPTDLHCKESTCNNGKGTWMEFGKAGNWDFDDDMKCTLYNEFKTWEDGRQVTRKDKVFTFQLV